MDKSHICFLLEFSSDYKIIALSLLLSLSSAWFPVRDAPDANKGNANAVVNSSRCQWQLSMCTILLWALVQKGLEG